jgi:hypothetical protein
LFRLPWTLSVGVDIVTYIHLFAATKDAAESIRITEGDNAVCMSTLLIFSLHGGDLTCAIFVASAPEVTADFESPVYQHLVWNYEIRRELFLTKVVHFPLLIH